MYNVIKKLFFSLVCFSLLSLVSSSICTNLVVNMQFPGECTCLSHLIDLVDRMASFLGAEPRLDWSP